MWRSWDMVKWRYKTEKDHDHQVWFFIGRTLPRACVNFLHPSIFTTPSHPRLFGPRFNAVGCRLFPPIANMDLTVGKFHNLFLLIWQLLNRTSAKPVPPGFAVPTCQSESDSVLEESFECWYRPHYTSTQYHVAPTAVANSISRYFSHICTRHW